jgi:hypothetical protein
MELLAVTASFATELKIPKKFSFGKRLSPNEPMARTVLDELLPNCSGSRPAGQQSIKLIHSGSKRGN